MYKCKSASYVWYKELMYTVFTVLDYTPRRLLFFCVSDAAFIQGRLFEGGVYFKIISHREEEERSGLMYRQSPRP